MMLDVKVSWVLSERTVGRREIAEGCNQGQPCSVAVGVGELQSAWTQALASKKVQAHSSASM